MKKHLLSSLFAMIFALCATNATAQVCPKGAVLLGGSIGLTSFSNDGDSDVVFSFAPAAGFFIIDDLAIGASLGITVTDGFSQFSVGPFARYYFLKALFAEAGLNFASTKFEGFDSDSSTNFGFGLGYSLFLNEGVAIEPGLAFNFGDGQTVIGLNIGVQAFLNR